MVLKSDTKEVVVNATLRKIVEINKKFKVKNFKDVFFKAMNDMDLAFLGQLIFEFCEDQSIFNKDINQVYDFMTDWIQGSDVESLDGMQPEPRSYEKMYKLLAEEINLKSFFGKKMSEKELEDQLKDPLASFDINKMIANTAEKVMGEVVAEEFKGFRG